MMSYDLMVFDPDLAPRKAEVGDWHRGLMEEDDRGSDDPFDPVSGKSIRLRAFYDDLRVDFPAMNGPDQTDDVDNEQVTGYAFYPGFIYMDFRWSAAEAGSKSVLALAEKHGLGLFDPQDPDDGVMLMGTTGSGPLAKVSWWARLFGG
jgi:hypothetical protein